MKASEENFLKQLTALIRTNLLYLFLKKVWEDSKPDSVPALRQWAIILLGPCHHEPQATSSELCRVQCLRPSRSCFG